ncbi:MAG: class I SAM-dependent methyltransferase, partial [Actinomycetota bacterium]
MGSTFTRGLGLHARIYDALCGWEERHGLLEWRQALVGDLDTEVVEIGAGTGLNLPHYPPGARVIASDYDPVMLARAIPRAASAAADVRLLVADAMALPFADASAEFVVIGLMLCSVPKPDVALTEARRILKPGGRLRVVEHVRAPDGSRKARMQDRINPAWRLVSGGCNANRRTLENIERAGFAISEVRDFELGLPHLKPHI